MATCCAGAFEHAIARGSSTELQRVSSRHPVSPHSSTVSHWSPHSSANQPLTAQKLCASNDSMSRTRLWSSKPLPPSFAAPPASTPPTPTRPAYCSSTQVSAGEERGGAHHNGGTRTASTQQQVWPPHLSSLPRPPSLTLPSPSTRAVSFSPLSTHPDTTAQQGSKALAAAVGFLLAVGVMSCGVTSDRVAEAAASQQFTDLPALRGKDYGKSAMRYPDYVLTDSGLQYKDLREGSGPIPKDGQTVVIDWDGFTIGYLGRIFEARNKAKGGSFEGANKEFYRFRVGDNKVIPAFEEAVATMKLGGVRRIVVPPEIGYPDNNMDLKGPKPLTFSGQRALDFVLKNQGMIDKTLLFDIELIRID